MRSLFLRMTAFLLPLALIVTLINVGCGDPKPSLPDGTKTEVTTDGGTDKKIAPDTSVKPDDKTVKPDDKKVNPDDKKVNPDDKVNPDKGGTDVCPPGCNKGKCASTVSGKKKLGETCKVPEKGKENPCDPGLSCFEARVINGQFYAPITQCMKVCAADTECDTGKGQTCVNTGDTKLCMTLKKEGELCNPTLMANCGAPSGISIDCLVKDVQNDREGSCTRRCTGASDCSTLPGKICRKPIPTAGVSYCLNPALPGPKCLGEACDVSSTATNCLSSLSCLDKFCVKNCTNATADKDCDKAAGEKCFQPLGTPVGHCQPKPSITKVGEECTPLKRCDTGLACISSGDKTICVKKCDTGKGEKSNPDCAASDLCQKPSASIPFGICRQQAKFDEACGSTSVCGDVPSACINVDATIGAVCLRLCDPAKNKADDLNPDCDGGTGACRTLQNGISSGGKSYKGACFAARPKTRNIGDSCAFNKKDGLKSPGCKDGSLCINLGGSAGLICTKICDPCTSFKKDGDWRHQACSKGTKVCNPLTSGTNGICIPDGNPVREEGELCDFRNGCKDPDNVVCVTFSRDDDASGVCSRKCDPEKGTTSNPGCPNNGRCAGLSNGGGVCTPERKRTQKLGEGCNGDVGTPRHGACLEKTKDGKELFCADTGISGVTGTCQVFCDPTLGFKDNKNCKSAGLTNHLCLPGDLSQPNKGACLELCSFSNRKDCSQKQCQSGVCREFLLGKRDECTSPDKEKDCKLRGGECINKTCLSTVCL